MNKRFLTVLFICAYIFMSEQITCASSENINVQKDVVLYSITLKEPDPEAVKQGLAINEPGGSKLAELAGDQAQKPQAVASKVYDNYYKRIRNKIRDRLVSRYYAGLAEGEISLVFILNSSGRLESVNIDEPGSVKDSNLRDITIRSVKDSAPFPPFPKNLDVSKMSFDLSVSFRKN